MKQLSPRCPKCSNRYCKAIDSGADVDENPLRHRKCECGHRFVTIEIALPGIKFSAIDVIRREYQKQWRRVKTGYQGKSANRKYPDPIRLIIEVKRRSGIFADTILRLDGSNIALLKRNEEAAPNRDFNHKDRKVA